MEGCSLFSGSKFNSSIEFLSSVFSNLVIYLVFVTTVYFTSDSRCIFCFLLDNFLSGEDFPADIEVSQVYGLCCLWFGCRICFSSNYYLTRALNSNLLFSLTLLFIWFLELQYVLPLTHDAFSVFFKVISCLVRIFRPMLSYLEFMDYVFCASVVECRTDFFFYLLMILCDSLGFSNFTGVVVLITGIPYLQGCIRNWWFPVGFTVLLS